MYDLNELTVEQKVELELILKAGYEPEQARKASMFLLQPIDEYNKKDQEVGDVVGNFEVALTNLIADVKSNSMSSSDILYQWDKTRGKDWFTSTKLLESKVK